MMSTLTEERERRALEWRARRVRTAIYRTRDRNRVGLEKMLAELNAEPEDAVFRATVAQTGHDPDDHEPTDS